MANEVATAQKTSKALSSKNTIKDMLNPETAFGREMASRMAPILGKVMSPERMLRVALATINKTPKLAECTPHSLRDCLMTLAQYGLSPDGRNAHLIPFENRRAGTVECQLIIDYKGFVDLVYRTGKVVSVRSEIVCENDEFAWTDGIVHHSIDWRKPRGNPFAAYSCIEFIDGHKVFEVMSVDEINAVRDNSNGVKVAKRFNRETPWDTHWPEMAKKTVFRRLTKWVPISQEVNDALNADTFDAPFEVVDAEPTPRRKRASASAIAEAATSDDDKTPRLTAGEGFAIDDAPVADAEEPEKDYVPIP